MPFYKPTKCQREILKGSSVKEPSMRYFIAELLMDET